MHKPTVRQWIGLAFLIVISLLSHSRNCISHASRRPALVEELLPHAAQYQRRQRRNDDADDKSPFTIFLLKQEMRCNAINYSHYYLFTCSINPVKLLLLPLPSPLLHWRLDDGWLPLNQANLLMCAWKHSQSVRELNWVREKDELQQHNGVALDWRPLRCHSMPFDTQRESWKWEECVCVPVCTLRVDITFAKFLSFIQMKILLFHISQ